MTPRPWFGLALLALLALATLAAVILSTELPPGMEREPNDIVRVDCDHPAVACDDAGA